MQAMSMLGFRYLWVGALCSVQDSGQGKDDADPPDGQLICMHTLVTIVGLDSCHVQDGLWDPTESRRHPGIEAL
jgi:hypothetical protein